MSVERTFNEEQRLLQETLRAFALEHLLPAAPRWEVEPFPRPWIRDLGDLGVPGGRARQVRGDHRLGEEGRGFVETMEAFDFNPALIALACIGAARQSLDETIAYAKQRKTFGKPLAMREAVAFQVAEHLATLQAGFEKRKSVTGTKRLMIPVG